MSTRPSFGRGGPVGPLVLAALLLAGCRESTPRPAVVLISIDCLNQRQFADAMAAGTMPALQAVARESLVFSRAHAHAPWTTPSHMSMLTGLYPSQHGRDLPSSLQAVIVNTYDRVPSFRTIADRLAAAGYETVAFVGKGSISADFGLAQGFQRFHESARKPDTSDLPVTDDLVIQWLIERDSRPFFLFFHTYDLHGPRPHAYSSDEGALRMIDAYLADLFTQLRNRGLWDDALVFVTGDHGSDMIRTTGKCCSHGSGHYEENLHVPLVVKLPHAAERGESDRLVAHVDILPTVLDVLHLPKGDYVGPGVSVLQTLHAEPAPERFSYSEADAYCAPRRGLVNERYNYIYAPHGAELTLMSAITGYRQGCTDACRNIPVEEFFDLEADPYEEHNLLLTDLNDEQARALERFRAEMERHLNLPRFYTRRVVADEEVGKPVDEAVRKALKALGYVQ